LINKIGSNIQCMSDTNGKRGMGSGGKCLYVMFIQLAIISSYLIREQSKLVLIATPHRSEIKGKVSDVSQNVQI